MRINKEQAETKVVYLKGIPERYRSSAAQLYDEAFGAKFSVAVRDKEKRLSLLEKGFELDYAIAAISDDELIGVAGFHTTTGSLTGGITYSDLVSLLGYIEGSWAALIFSLYERKPKPGELVMDGIAVNGSLRGEGTGSRLLDEVAGYGKANRFNRVRLDVIDVNPRAKKLYERKGFKAVREEKFTYLRWLLGFGGSTTMELRY